MGGKNNRGKSNRKAERAWLRSSLDKSQKAGGGFGADPGNIRQTLISRIWESLMEDKK